MATSSMNWENASPHVLAVDDNLVDRKLVEKLLKNSSCRVTTAENGLRALEYLGLGDDQHNTSNNDNGSKVNMIITDYCMPEMTGYELLKKIKSSKTKSGDGQQGRMLQLPLNLGTKTESSHMKDIPVVIMSSENIPTRINQCLEEGAQMFMLKPLKHADVKRLRGELMQCRG